MVMFYVSPYLIDRTLQDFEELVNAGILQSNDLKQSGVKGVKKLYIYICICRKPLQALKKICISLCWT